MSQLNITKNINKIRQELEKLQEDKNIKIPNIIAVSKKHNILEIKEAIDSNVPYIGESYIQEAIPKIETIPFKNWDFIGRIQTNKIKYIVKYFNRIHSVSKLKHIIEINKLANKLEKNPALFIQINIANEDTKEGISNYQDLKKIITESFNLKDISFKLLGLMCIPPKTINPENSRKYFADLRKMMFKINQDLGISLNSLSMGMSNDYKIAAEEGSTDLRIGTAIFGARKQ